MYHKNIIIFIKIENLFILIQVFLKYLFKNIFKKIFINLTIKLINIIKAIINII